MKKLWLLILFAILLCACGSKPTEEEATRSPYGSSRNPYPLGVEARLERTVNGERIPYALKVEAVMRGEDAWAIAQQASEENEQPGKDFELMLVQVRVRNLSSTGRLDLKIYDAAFYSQGWTSTNYHRPVCCLAAAGYPDFEGDLDPLEERSGWIPFSVRKDDTEPMLVLEAETQRATYFALE